MSEPHAQWVAKLDFMSPGVHRQISRGNRLQKVTPLREYPKNKQPPPLRQYSKKVTPPPPPVAKPHV